MDLDDEEETGALTAMEMLNDVDTEVSEYTPNTIVLQLFLSFPILSIFLSSSADPHRPFCQHHVHL